jgi:ABC-type glutathione transport system ATPase component
MTAALSVRNLSIAFARRKGGSNSGDVLDGIALDVRQGEILALVGESGSGKSITALAIMGLLPSRARITSGEIAFGGRDMLALNDTERRHLRGARIGMVFQEPMTSLNPVLTIGRQMSEALVEHKDLSGSEVRARVLAMVERVGLGDGPTLLKRYPHELSGGMRQRVMIAMAMVLEPALLIADEPTTALDVTVQAQILDLLRDLVRTAGASLLLITHDMGVVAEIADRVVVMQRGRVVETRDVHELFGSPSQNYTRALLAAVPRLDGPGRPLPSDCGEGPEPVLRLDRISKSYASGGLFKSRDSAKAVAGVSLSVMPGETLALVGESGSGKSTLGRAAARLIDVDEGRVIVDGEDLTWIEGRRLRAARSTIQMIFQDPFASLDPRFTLLASIAEPMLVSGLADRGTAPGKAIALMERVGLSRALSDRLPHELSGGQRQRISIARALAAEPKIIVADEPTSALDVSVQAQVLALLAELQEERGLTFLFITHDLAIVRQIAHRVAVMRGGKLLELGPADAVLRSPQHEYTQALLAAAPVPDPTRRRQVQLIIAPVGLESTLSEFVPGHWVAR